MVVVQEVEQQDARLRSLGIGVDAEVKERFKLTEENLRSRGFREKHKPVGFFSCVGLGLFVFVSVIVGFNYIQLRHPIDPRSAEQVPSDEVGSGSEVWLYSFSESLDWKTQLLST